MSTKTSSIAKMDRDRKEFNTIFVNEYSTNKNKADSYLRGYDDHRSGRDFNAGESDVPAYNRGWCLAASQEMGKREPYGC